MQHSYLDSKLVFFLFFSFLLPCDLERTFEESFSLHFLLTAVRHCIYFLTHGQMLANHISVGVAEMPNTWHTLATIYFPSQ